MNNVKLQTINFRCAGFMSLSLRQMSNYLVLLGLYGFHNDVSLTSYNVKIKKMCLFFYNES